MAEANDYGDSSTVLRSAPRQCSVARWKKLEIVETRTLKAERLLQFHRKKRTLLNLRAALRTMGLAQVLEHNGLRRLVELLLKALLFLFGELRRYKMRAVALLNPRVSTLGKLQDYGPGPIMAQVLGLAGFESLFPCPAAKYRHGRGNLLEIPLNHPFQEIDSPLPPGVYLRRRQ